MAIYNHYMFHEIPSIGYLAEEGIRIDGRKDGRKDWRMDGRTNLYPSTFGGVIISMRS